MLPEDILPERTNRSNIKQLWGSAQVNNRKASENQQRHYNLRRRKWTPKVGARVRRISNRQFHLQIGGEVLWPYTVTSIIQANIVEIKDERGKALRAHV